MRKYKIKLIKNSFYNEDQTLKKLYSFIKRSKILSMDKNVKEFENKFSEWQNCNYSTMVNSGSSANLILLQSLKNLGWINEGDNIGFSSLTWATNVMPIIQMKFNPIPIDVDISTLNMSVHAFEKTIMKYSLKCLFITNALGFCSELEKIKKICEKNQIILLEDNCESLGTEIYNGNFRATKTGNFGLASTFSFYVSHHICTIEGGMVSTYNKELNDMLIRTRAHGWNRNLDIRRSDQLMKMYNIGKEYEKYTFFDLAFNFRPMEIQGFLGVEQLKYVNKIIMKRNENFIEFYNKVFGNDELINLDISDYMIISNFAFPVICKTRELKEKYLKKFEDAKIETRPMIAGNITMQPFWKKYIKVNYKLPNTNFLHNNSFYVGNNPDLTKKELDLIFKCLER